MRSIRTYLHVTGLALALVAPARAAEFEKYLPNDTEFVVSMNVEQLLNSSLGKKYLRAALEQALKDNPHGQEILKALNFDPLKDLSRVMIAATGMDTNDALAILTGKFDRAKIEETLAKFAAEQPDKVKIHKTGSTTVYEMIDDEKKANFAGFASSTTLLAGPKLASVKAALSGGGSGGAKKELTVLFPKSEQQTAWLAALPKVAGALPNENGDIKKALEGLEGITGRLNIETSAKLNVTLSSKNVQALQAVAIQLGGGIDFLKQNGPGLVKEKPELAPLLEVLNTLKIAAKQKALTLSAELSGPAIEKIIANAKKDK